MPDVPPPIVAGRSCAGCTMCCKLPALHALNKPPRTWCVNCDIGKGCRIYETRPDDCRTFHCGWLLDATFGDPWRPRDSRMVTIFQPNRILILVDEARKGAWRKEPFHSHIRSLARAALATRGEVVVIDGDEALRIMPDGETKVG